jgi:hypothetical protein
MPGGIGAAEVAQYSLAPRDLLATVWPWAVGFGGPTYWGGMRITDFPQYLGAPTVALAVLGLWRAGAATGPGRVFLAVTGAAGLILSLGTHLGPLHTLLATHVPLWSSFRLPVNALILTQLAVALLAAREHRRSPGGTRRPATALLVAAAVMAGAALAMLGPLRVPARRP